MAVPVNTRWPAFFRAPVEQMRPQQPERFGGPNLQNALMQQQQPDEYDGDDIEEYNPDTEIDPVTGLDPMSDFQRQQGQVGIMSSFASHGMGLSTPMMVALAGNDRAARAEAYNRRRQAEKDKIDLALKRQEFGIRREELELRRLQLESELAEKFGPSPTRQAHIEDERARTQDDNETDYSTNRRPRTEDGKF